MGTITTWAEIGIKNLSDVGPEIGMNELFVLCIQRPDRSVERQSACVKAARLLASGARRVAIRETASMLLSEIHDFVTDDVSRARDQQWMGVQFYEIMHPVNTGSRLAFVRAEISFVNDWIESSDEVEAMRRTLVRGGKPLHAPENFRLNEAWYANFERVQSNERAQTK